MGAADARGRFVTDTTKCLVEGFLQAHRAEHVPQVIVFGEESSLEQVEISCYQLLQRLCSSPVLPHTTAPPPGEFVKACCRQLERAETILSIHPSSEVSRTVRSAISARALPFPRADIRLPGARTAAGPRASIVRLAVAWSEGGVPADEIMRRLEALIPRSRAPAAAETLECLRRGGRIGGASAVLGSVLVTEAMLELRQGKVEPLENVRTHQRALDRHNDLALGDYPRSGGGLAVGDAWRSARGGSGAGHRTQDGARPA